MSFGDRLVVLQVRDKGVTAAHKGRTLTAPVAKNARKVLSSDRRQLDAFHKTAVQMTKEVIDPGKSKALANTDLLATLQIAGQYVQEAPALAGWFTLTGEQLTWLLIAYGFIASVLPVWLLLAPRD